MNRIDLIVLSPANHFRNLSGKPSSKLDGYHTQQSSTTPTSSHEDTGKAERRKDADDSELLHNNSSTQAKTKQNPVRPSLPTFVI
jgi:hypothetical protein